MNRFSHPMFYTMYVYVYPTNLSDSLAAVFCCLLSRHQHFWVHSLLLSFATGWAGGVLQKTPASFHET